MTAAPPGLILGGLSAACVMAGTLIACNAERYPQHRTVVETVAGIILILGLGLLGFGVGCVLGPP